MLLQLIPLHSTNFLDTRTIFFSNSIFSVGLFICCLQLKPTHSFWQWLNHNPCEGYFIFPHQQHQNFPKQRQAVKNSLPPL